MESVFVSVIMPCYNAGKYLDKAIESVSNQSLTNWELVIVNDGSLDDSESIAQGWANKDKRVRVVSKKNGGYVSARLLGYELCSMGKYLIFFDADDILHSQMLERLVTVMELDDRIGAAYANHRIMDENGVLEDKGIEMPRFVPTRFWVKELPDSEIFTPFVSIFCWTKMIEPMTMLRRVAYEGTPGWDIDFGKGKGNIGEGVYLFSEIALKWKVYFERERLYYYRRHSSQISSISDKDMYKQVEKVISKWENRLGKEPKYAEKVKPAILFLRYRVAALKKWGSLPHDLSTAPLRAIYTFFQFMIFYLKSTPLIFSFKKLTNNSKLL